MFPIRHLFRILLPSSLLAVLMLCALLLEANDRYRYALQAASESSPESAPKPMKAEAKLDAAFQYPELAGLRHELALAEQELEELTVAYQAARQKASPDFQRLKAEALAELESRRQEMEHRNPAMWSRPPHAPGPDIAQVAASFADRQLRRYGPALDAIGLDAATQRRIHEAFRERGRVNAELGQRVRRGEITPAESRREMRLGNDVDLIMEFLTDEEKRAFEQAEEERQKNQQRLAYARIVASQAGDMSLEASELLTEGFAAMNEASLNNAGRSPAEQGQKRLEALSELRQWMADQVDEEDMPGVEVFIELQRLTIERGLEANRQASSAASRRVSGGDSQ